jgi:hypothetical protein
MHFIRSLDFLLLMGGNPLLGPLEGVGPKKPRLFRAQMALASPVAVSGP